MLLRVVNYIKGSVRISVEGVCIERFLNLCAINNIPFWGIKRKDESMVYAAVGIDDFRKLRRFAKKCMCRVRIVKKEGVPFAAHRWRKRYAMYIGAFVCAALMWAMSNVVWTIGIEGCKDISEQEVLKMLSECGLRAGVISSEIEEDEIKHDMMKLDERLQFLIVNIKGSHAQVIVREKEQQPIKLEAGVPCDFVSDKTGIVEKLHIKSGKAMLEKGMTVQSGQIIAQGRMVSAQNEEWLVHADADVVLRTWKSVKSVLSTDILALKETGRVKKRTSIIIGNKRFKLYFIENKPFAWYDIKIEENPVLLPGGAVLPISLHREIFIEVERVPLEISGQKASGILEERLNEQLLLSVRDGSVLRSEFKHQIEKGIITGILSAECLEKCGVHIPIGGTE